MTDRHHEYTMFWRWPGKGSCLLLVLSLLPLPAAAQDIQRLFTSPEQRMEMDRRRAQALAPEPEVAEVVPAETAVVESTEAVETIDIVYRFQGVVRREGEPLTIWLNGVAVSEANLPDNMEVLLSQNLLRIHQPLSGRLFDIKPGQILNLTRGQVLESFAATERDLTATITNGGQPQVSPEPIQAPAADAAEEPALEPSAPEAENGSQDGADPNA